MQPAQLNEERMNKLAETFGSKDKVLQVLKEYTCLPLYVLLVNNYLIPTRIPYVPLSPHGLNPNSPLELVENQNSEAQIEYNVGDELHVSRISNCRWNEDLNVPQWLVYYSGNFHHPV